MLDFKVVEEGFRALNLDSRIESGSGSLARGSMKVDEGVAADRRGCDSLDLEENKVCISSESKSEEVVEKEGRMTKMKDRECLSRRNLRVRG